MKLVYEYGELQADGVTVNAAANAGNIAKQTVTFAGQTAPFVQGYRYDSLDRVTEAVEKVSGTQSWKQTFGYDIYGNRNSRYQIIGSSVLPINNTTLPTVVSTTNRYSSGQGYGYDKNGNIISDVDPATSHNRSFTFNGDNKQTQVTDTTSGQVKGTYVYDGNARRVKKVTETETTVFVYNGMGNLVAEYSTATPPTNPTIHYTATDTLGSPRLITNAQGQVESRRDFMPFGEELYADGTYRKTTDKYTTTGQDAIRQKFTGYQRDPETSLDFAEARMYNFQHGRFASPDAAKMLKERIVDPQHWNLYVYARNSPLLLIDVSGQFPYTFHIRSFAPPDSFKSFGFRDDNRGYSVGSDGGLTSRIKQSFTLDTVTETLSGGQAVSDATHFIGLGDAFERVKTANPRGFARIESIGKDPSTNFLIKAAYSGNNPLVPGSPNIDVQTSIGVLEDRKKGTLTIGITLSGDGFPATEAFVADAKGNKVFLAGGPAYGNPLNGLNGTGMNPVASSTIIVNFDKKGIFTGVTYNGNRYGLDEWNKKATSDPAGPFDRNELQCNCHN